MTRPADDDDRLAVALRLLGWCVALLLPVYAWTVIQAPLDSVQGIMQKILYVHPPLAYGAYLGFVATAIASGLFLWRGREVHDQLSIAGAEVGTLFCTLMLITGPIWARGAWGPGNWWVWDARLTSMLILLFFYVAVIALANGFDRVERGSRPAALLALVGVLNVPIVKFSVDWWNTLHQPASLIRSGGFSVDSAMLTPLLLMLGGFHLYFAAVIILRMKTLLIERRITSLQLRHSRQPAVASEAGQ